jgi:hypothetical protein
VSGVDSGADISAVLEIYVYFRAAPAREDAVRAALAKQRTLAGLACGAQLRAGPRMEAPDAASDWLTWLEVYRFEGRVATQGWPAATLEAIERCAAASGLADCALAGRHREVFRMAD